MVSRVGFHLGTRSFDAMYRMRESKSHPFFAFFLARVILFLALGLNTCCDSLVLHSASLLRTVFASLARAYQRARLDIEINAPFLLKSTVTPNVYFIISMRTISSVTEKNINRNLWLLFWQMKQRSINTTERDIKGPNNACPNCVSFRG